MRGQGFYGNFFICRPFSIESTCNIPKGRPFLAFSCGISVNYKMNGKEVVEVKQVEKPKKPSEKPKKPNCCQKFQDVIFGNMERFFKGFGHKVASHPFITILISLMVAGILMVGLVRYRSETDQNELWVPTNSDLYDNNKWKAANFPSKIRFQQYMLISEKGDNVLTKKNFLKLVEISKAINDLEFNKTKHTAICTGSKSPCSCIEFTILTLWDKCGDMNVIKSKIEAFDNDNAMIDDMNSLITKNVDVDTMLGENVKDKNGKVISATAIKVGLINDVTEEYDNEFHQGWEQEFIWYLGNVTVS